jgi:hypothetical protein
MGGTVVVLTPAKPKAGIDGCLARMRNLAAAECERLMGMPCEPHMLALEDPVIDCPTHLVIGEREGAGRKIAVLPQTVTSAVCFEMTGHFDGG